ncbi:MAG: hypothetical protein II690_01005, partial [Ruminococcus sp.]|nr:hypothetical protein [Ruminococcus sp.]
INLTEAVNVGQMFGNCTTLKNDSAYSDIVSKWKIDSAPPFLTNGNNNTWMDNISGWQKCSNCWIYFTGTKITDFSVTEPT